VIVGCGVASALHVGKLLAALPVLTQERGITLVQGGLLLAMIPFAGKTLGAMLGQMAERHGARRVMRTGLTLLGVGSLIGAMASAPQALLRARAAEGLGFLMAVLPAPGLLRRAVPEGAVLSRALGWWRGYMPTGVASGMLLAAASQAWLGWRLTRSGLGLSGAAGLGLRAPDRAIGAIRRLAAVGGGRMAGCAAAGRVRAARDLERAGPMGGGVWRVFGAVAGSGGFFADGLRPGGLGGAGQCCRRWGEPGGQCVGGASAGTRRSAAGAAVGRLRHHGAGRCGHVQPDRCGGLCRRAGLFGVRRPGAGHTVGVGGTVGAGADAGVHHRRLGAATVLVRAVRRFAAGGRAGGPGGGLAVDLGIQRGVRGLRGGAGRGAGMRACGVPRCVGGRRWRGSHAGR